MPAGSNGHTFRGVKILKDVCQSSLESDSSRLIQ